MEINNQSIIGNIVAENYKAASIFKKYNIDFCCNGNRTISDAVNEKQLNSEILINELKVTIDVKSQGEIDFKAFPIDLLADYIEKTHHRYIDSKIPEITPYLKKIVSVHGEHHPETVRCGKIISRICQRSVSSPQERGVNALPIH